MASYTLQGFTNDASSADLDATNLNEMDNAIKIGHDFADGASVTPSAGKAMVWPENASGTFEPALSFGGSSTGITYTGRVGEYTKIGNVVFFRLRITLSNKGTAVGAVYVGGLPFPIKSTTYSPSSASCVLSRVTSTGQIQPLAASYGGNYYLLRNLTSSGVDSSLTESNFTNTSVVILSGFYFV